MCRMPLQRRRRLFAAALLATTLGQPLLLLLLLLLVLLLLLLLLLCRRHLLLCGFLLPELVVLLHPLCFDPLPHCLRTHVTAGTTTTLIREPIA